jgi:hypothetical protein
MSNLTVANTILEQLGGGRFIAMTGAKSFVGGEDSLHQQGSHHPGTERYLPDGVLQGARD